MNLTITVNLQDLVCDTQEAAYAAGCGESEFVGLDLNESVKKLIIDAVIDKLAKGVQGELKARLDAQLDAVMVGIYKRLEVTMQEKAFAFAESWLAGDNLKLTDKWGEVTKVTSLKGILEDSFESIMQKKVDEQGRFDQGYNAKMTFLQFVSGNQLKKIISEKLPKLGGSLEAEIRDAIKKHSKTLVAEQLAEILGSGK